MFERIAKSIQPLSASDKYAGTYEGKPINTGLATIAEGQEMQKFIFANIQKYRKTPTFIKSCNLNAKLTAAGIDTYISVEQMLNDRFPIDKPIDLFVEIEQGANREVGDDVGGGEVNPAETVGQVMFNVYDLAVSLLKNWELATVGLFDQIDRSAAVAAGGGIAAVLAGEDAKNTADNAKRSKKDK